MDHEEPAVMTLAHPLIIKFDQNPQPQVIFVTCPHYAKLPNEMVGGGEFILTITLTIRSWLAYNIGKSFVYQV